MPDLRFQAKPAARTEIPRPKRAESQWALGYTEPLNKNEQSKKDDDPLHVRDRILHIYSKRGFASIDPADLRGRFRWMGLYTQRAPGFDGGKTAMLEEEELEDVPEIWQRLDDAGLTSLEACGDSPRPFLGSPVAGVAADEIIDGTPALEEIKRRYINNPEFSNLPRKFKTSLTGHPSHDV